MFSHIKTSKENKEVVTLLTNKLNLGAENAIARIALTYSLSLGEKLNIKDIQNSSGKEYSSKVLFGEYIDYYVGMTALHYNLHISDKDLSKSLKSLIISHNLKYALLIGFFVHILIYFFDDEKIFSYSFT